MAKSDTRSAPAPLVSIGLPVYNEERFLRQALHSLLAQDFQDFEIIVSDNASQDATGEICLDCAARDARIRYLRNETNLGPIENFNSVFRLSSGKYFMWASGHDLWAPPFISRCVDVLEADPSAVLCYPQSVGIDAEGKPMRRADSHTDTRNWGVFLRFNLALWAVGCAWAFCGVYRAKALKQTRLLQRVIECDLVLLSELSLAGPFANVPEPLFYPRNKWGDEGQRKERWRRFFAALEPGAKSNRPWFPYLRWIHEELLGVQHARLGPLQKAILMGCVVPGYLSRYRVYLPRQLRLGMRRFLAGTQVLL